MNGQIILKINSKVTDEDIKLMSGKLLEARLYIYRLKTLYDVEEDTMEERERLFNKVSSLLEDKERLNQMINDFNQAYTFYELIKLSGADESFTLGDSMTEYNKNELRLQFLDLCAAIYVCTYGHAEMIFEGFEGVQSLEFHCEYEQLSSSDSICKRVYVNDEEIGDVFIDDVSKVIERYEERFAVIKH